MQCGGQGRAGLALVSIFQKVIIGLLQSKCGREWAKELGKVGHSEWPTPCGGQSAGLEGVVSGR